MSELSQPLNCIFNDIIRLDFKKFKMTLIEFQTSRKAMLADRALRAEQAAEEKKAEEEKKEGMSGIGSQLTVHDGTDAEKADIERVKRITDFLGVMSRAAKFAMNSQSWLQLVSILMYVWNTFAYELTNPLELTSLSEAADQTPEAWKSIVILAECSLYLMEHLKKGGKLRTLAGKDIDKVKNQKSML